MLKKLVSCALLIAAVSSFVFAADSAEIDSSILDKAYAETYIDSKSPVSWRDYNSGKQIRDMGRRLGSEIKYQSFTAKADNPYASGFPSLKYKVSRIYPGDKAGADVIYIAKNAGVNTIKNMRRIVSGYIEKAYDIPMDKADTIAVKVCYWNTNHYDDRAYFKENFQPRVNAVFANRTKIMGLARSYKNWPGKTRLVIPFVLIKEEVPTAVEPTQPTEAPAVQETTPQPETPTVPEVPVEEASSGVPVLTIVLLLVLVAAILVVVIILVRHHMSSKENENDGTPEA